MCGRTAFLTEIVLRYEMLDFAHICVFRLPTNLLRPPTCFATLAQNMIELIAGVVTRHKSISQLNWQFTGVARHECVELQLSSAIDFATYGKL